MQNVLSKAKHQEISCWCEVLLNEIKEKWNRGKGTLRERPHPANPSTCEKHLRNYQFLKSTASKSLCKCNSRTESGSMPSKSAELGTVSHMILASESKRTQEEGHCGLFL